MCFAGSQQAMDITSGPVTGRQNRMARGFALLVNRSQANSGDQGAQQRLSAFRSNFAAAHGGMSLQDVVRQRRAAAGQTGTTGGMTGGGGGY